MISNKTSKLYQRVQVHFGLYNEPNLSFLTCVSFNLNQKQELDWKLGVKCVLHDVPVQLHLLHILHHFEYSSLEVGLKANIIFKDQGLIHLHVHHLWKKKYTHCKPDLLNKSKGLCHKSRFLFCIHLLYKHDSWFSAECNYFHLQLWKRKYAFFEF